MTTAAHKPAVPPNAFSGVRTATLEARLRRLKQTVEKITAGEDEGGGGSPLEGLYEKIEDIEAELHRREVIPNGRQIERMASLLRDVKRSGGQDHWSHLHSHGHRYSTVRSAVLRGYLREIAGRAYQLTHEADAFFVFARELEKINHKEATGMTAIFELCSHCGRKLGAFRAIADGEPLCRLCAPADPRHETAEMVSALLEIAAGIVDEGGNRRNHPDATRIAREALGLKVDRND